MEPTEETKVKAILDRIVANKAYSKEDLDYLSNRRDAGFIECQESIKYTLGLPADL